MKKFVKRKIALMFAALIAVSMFLLAGCDQATRVSYNLSQQADNFNAYRQLTVINCITNETVFQMTGKMSITSDNIDHQLEVVVEDDGAYKKHIIGLSDNTTYVVEDITGNNVNQYHYEINFNPNLWMPYEPTVID